jgi:hypothetical protein
MIAQSWGIEPPMPRTMGWQRTTKDSVAPLRTSVPPPLRVMAWV